MMRFTDVRKIEPESIEMIRLGGKGDWPFQRDWLQVFPPTRLQWVRLRVPIADLPAGLSGTRILHLTDLHMHRHWPAGLEALFQRIAADPPHLLLFTGDFVDNKNNFAPSMANVRRFVQGLTARWGCFAIHGNHDKYQIGRQLSDTHLAFLDGRRHVLNTLGGSIELIGLPGRRRLQCTPKLIDSIPPRTTGVPRVVLSHFPDNYIRTGGLDADLFLCGHTHGGQICLPGGVPLMWHDAMPAQFARDAHFIGRTCLIVGRGIGWTGLPLRVFCPSEAIEIVLTHDQART